MSLLGKVYSQLPPNTFSDKVHVNHETRYDEIHKIRDFGDDLHESLSLSDLV